VRRRRWARLPRRRPPPSHGGRMPLGFRRKIVDSHVDALARPVPARPPLEGHQPAGVVLCADMSDGHTGCAAGTVAPVSGTSSAA